MPLYNQVGEPMPKIELTRKETVKLNRLGALEYPKDAEIIFHLSPSEFRIWLYLLNPREALLLTSTTGINLRIRAQLKNWRWSRLTDFVWRLVH